MSQREDLKDALLEELSILEVFRRLVRCTPARSKLLRIVAALMASNKPLPRRLSEAYEGRFAVSQPNADEDTEQEAAAPATVEDVAKLSDSNKACNESNTACSTTTIASTAGASCSHSSSSSGGDTNNKKTVTASTVMQEIPPPPIVNVEASTLPTAHALEPLEALPDEDALAVDLGLRLGSFLSEAGWMQESITVLVCLNERLKRMQPFRDQFITRLDCLQRYVTNQTSLNLCHVNDLQ